MSQNNVEFTAQGASEPPEPVVDECGRAGPAQRSSDYCFSGRVEPLALPMHTATGKKYGADAGSARTKQQRKDKDIRVSLTRIDSAATNPARDAEGRKSTGKPGRGDTGDTTRNHAAEDLWVHPTLSVGSGESGTSREQQLDGCPIEGDEAVPTAKSGTAGETRMDRGEGTVVRKAKPAPTPTPRGAKGLRRTPTTAAVAITVAEGGKLTYAEVVEMAREKVSLTELGIETGVRPRRSRTGGLLLELKGPECQQKAEKLAERVAAVLDGTGARVAQPMKRADLRITGLDDSVKIEEIF
ncbi:uncharacterized protein LOC143259742 [Megalopta genalis]|uniref:uncharacterized protein LOC143259742 n=1 Tax=Megalopta genalis TaxID=115081 RepID=UPI003FD554F2